MVNVTVAQLPGHSLAQGFTAGATTGLVNRTSRSRSVKNKAATNGGERQAHRGVRRPLFAQEDDEVLVTGSTLYTLETKAGQPPWL